MKYRITIWAISGFLVAGFWAIYAIATFPATNASMRELWTLISLSCPIAILGQHHPISIYEVLAANALTYALVGMGVETLLRQFRRGH
ncbi:MAG TPA: hypothetical protein VJO35_14075 [Terriglobales bacterium]|nr:hypothetical protein [Terriglobales bacterium]